MKVLFDYQVFKQNIGGVSRVTAEILRHFPCCVDYNIALRVCDNVYVKEYGIIPNVQPIPVSRDNLLTKKIYPFKMRLFNFLSSHFSSLPTFEHINKVFAVKLLKDGFFDIFHYPLTEGDDYFLKYLEGKKLVITVHDMISEKENPKGAQALLKKKLVNRADHIIAISEETKKDLIKYLDVNEERITVVYHGSPDPIKTNLVVEPSPYFLYVGRRSGYKNFKQSLMDFASFSKRHPDVKLICTGNPFTRTEQILINKLGIAGKCSTIWATEEELAALYKHAIAFIYPSLYEGFGLPILEAFVYNCIVLCNDQSCLPEVAGDAAIYFHSKDGESNLQEKLDFVFSLKENEKNQLIQKGNNRAKLFSWDKSAELISEVYEKVLNS